MSPVKRNLFAGALRILARQQRARTRHLSAAKLLAYRRKRMETPEAGRIQDHLSVCIPCADRYLQLGSSSNGAHSPR